MPPREPRPERVAAHLVGLSEESRAAPISSPKVPPATTAKLRPASPARAASMVALSASRLVCSAMSVMRLTTSPMRLAASLNSCTAALLRSASPTAFSAMAFEWATWRSISITEEASSSVDDAMSRTLVEASAEADVAFGAARRAIRSLGKTAGGFQHLIADRAELSNVALDRSCEGRDLG